MKNTLKNNRESLIEGKLKMNVADDNRTSPFAKVDRR